MESKLTELEGAVLTEVGHRGNVTAFKVRRAFELSRSANWRGSAGAVYAAIKRLVKRGILDAKPIEGERGGNRLALSRAGKTALHSWILDTGRATDSGFDPFRLRAGLWLGLSGDRLHLVLSELESSVKREILELQAYREQQDPVESVGVELAIRMQEVRLRWIDEQKSGNRLAPSRRLRS